MMSLDSEMASLFAGMNSAPRVASFAGSHPDLIRQFGKYDPLAMATNFAGLLTRRETRANCLRLQCLVALAIRYGVGHRRPSRELLARAFKALGSGWAGKSEDPAEDVAIARVSGKRGSYSMFTGLAEGAVGQLERFLDIVDNMPDGAPWEDLRESTYALLALSDEVVRRSGGAVNEIGAAYPVKTVPPGLLEALADSRDAVTFTTAELADLGIPPFRLASFMFDMEGRRELDGDPINMTCLDRRPIVAFEEAIVLAMPTVVCQAIQRLVIEFCLARGMKEALEGNLVKSYGRFLHETEILGGASGAPFMFRKLSDMSLASVLRKIDDGRWLQVVAWVDNLDGYETDNFSGTNQDPIGVGQAVAEEIRICAAKLSKEEGFRGGVTLVVSCGWGRGLTCAFEDPPPDWRMAFVSAHDLQSLSDLPGMRPTYLWRLLDMRDEVKRNGVELFNLNGLLNLVAWARKNDEHVIPHAQLPPEFGTVEPAMLAIEQNALLDLRHEAALSKDRRLLAHLDGQLIPVERTVSRPLDGQYLPHYASRELFRKGVLNGAVMTDARVWWVQMGASGGSDAIEIFRHWEMLHHWLGVAAPVLDACFSTLLPGPILWDVHFDNITPTARVEDENTFGDDQTAVTATLTCETGGNIVRIRAEADFQRAHQHVSNVAERTLVRALVAGTALLAGVDLAEEGVEEIAERIIPGRGARHIHHLRGQNFRDYVGNTLPRGYIEISPQDSALFKLGRAGRVRGAGGGTITGKADCVAFLNAAVARTERELCAALKEYARTPFLLGVIENYERVYRERSRGERTSLAVLAQRRGSDAAYRMLAEHEGERNAVMQSSRILLEAGLCECPAEGRTTFGEIDLSRLMVMANAIVVTGGWSNAIRWGAMEPSLKISPLGDILTDSTFEADIVAPFGLASNRVMTDAAVARYPEFYAPPAEGTAVDTLLNSRFAAAWIDEIGLSVDGVREVIDALEDHGIALGKAAFRISRENFATLVRKTGLEEDAADLFLRSFRLPARSTWFDLPTGFLPRDREAWRFQRQLSVLRRPILDPGDGELVVAPGMLREGVGYVLRNFYEGLYDQSFPVAAAMRSWIGFAKSTHGHAFNGLVANRLKDFGWVTKPDLKMTNLLSKGFPRNYGDVDVLAWNRMTGRVLLIECKDLQFRKTMGEIAEQLADFRGELDERGRPDLLRKHLDRHALATEHVTEVRRFTGLTVAPQIECHVVFRYPVPVAFKKSTDLAVRFTLFDELKSM